MLAAATNLAAQYCTEGGYKLEAFGPRASAPEPEPVPQPERMRW
jgi:hypothetical protein